MSLLEMSFAGGALILATIVLRALALHRLPRGTFLALWAVAAARLLIPFSIPSPASVYTLAENVQSRTAAPAVPAPSGAVGPAGSVLPGAVPAGSVLPGAVPTGAAVALPESGTAVNVWLLAWLAGAVVCGAFFLLSWLRCRREFRTALPVENESLQAWLVGQRLRRTVSLRRSGRVDAPMTCGVIRPVIIFPDSTDWTDMPRLAYVLEHELAHVRHLDALWKLVLAFTACVHWFNPLAWCMLVLANRDLELRCDEAVVRQMGLDRRSEYALTLISMEEKRSGLGPFASAFSKNAIEERIRAIMKIKKRSIAAILAAAVLVCCVGVGFATSAAKSKAPYPWVEEGTFTREELDRLSELWFEGYEEMTVAAYQQKMWSERDNRSDMELIERYGQSYQLGGVYSDDAATKDLNAFYNYFYNVYEPLTAERWQERSFPGMEGTRLADGSVEYLEYTGALRILDAEKLTVGEYERAKQAVKAGVRALLGPEDPTEDDFAALSRNLSTETLSVTVEGGLPVRTSAPPVDRSGDLNTSPYADTDPDAALHAQSSRESAAQWDELLSTYAPFGLTWQFDDPDLDGNGLTMWFQGKEVRGICDERKGLWITEHTGNSAYAEGAVELYAVYTGGDLTGLRFATPEEQAGWDASRQAAHPVTISMGTLHLPADAAPEEREFPRAVWEHYESLLTLRTVEDTDLPEWASHPYRDARDLTLEDFNQRLLDWANENPIPWDRINCDVLWNDYGVELTEEEQSFVSLTCLLSGTENGQMVRALYTGNPEEDPRISAGMPPLSTISEYADGCVTAWCDLYYDISYHIADKSKVSVRERDTAVGGMMNAISAFWRDTDPDTLLGMTEEEVVARFNAFAAENSTANVQINPVTADDIHFEAHDERGLRY